MSFNLIENPLMPLIPWKAKKTLPWQLKLGINSDKVSKFFTYFISYFLFFLFIILSLFFRREIYEQCTGFSRPQQNRAHCWCLNYMNVIVLNVICGVRCKIILFTQKSSKSHELPRSKFFSVLIC